MQLTPRVLFNTGATVWASFGNPVTEVVYKYNSRMETHTMPITVNGTSETTNVSVRVFQHDFAFYDSSDAEERA